MLFPQKIVRTNANKIPKSGGNRIILWRVVPKSKSHNQEYLAVGP